MISDAPGSVFVRDYYSATASSGTISVTQAALEAFQAGNDMLIVGRLAARLARCPGYPRCDCAFRQKYSTDPAFQQRVDSAVQRILRLKYRLYPNYDVTQVAVPMDQVRGKMNTGGGVARRRSRRGGHVALRAADLTGAVAAQRRRIRCCRGSRHPPGARMSHLFRRANTEPGRSGAGDQPECMACQPRISRRRPTVN